MQPPLPPGTVLSNRYRITRVLGQGGFGRTYLTEDQGRFNEACALKEFIPIQRGETVMDKARELFGREASTLYQLQHPQVPQFRATFEEGGRFFLVQDYIDGKTYRALLNERKLQGQTFSEEEIIRLLAQVMPVLSYIHGKNIIHRDIAPDNLILRSSDSKPVLIDFGVVKEAATRFQGDQGHQATMVGKLGYAPSEQLQTGRAYPSSDLYSLAATAVVLLSGHEPQDLFDDESLTWQWQRYLSQPVSPGLAQVLNRMLAYKPGDRYQTADEASQALMSLQSSQPDPNLSRVATMAVGRPPDTNVAPPVGPAARPRPTMAIPAVNAAPPESIWDKPWFPALVIVGLMLVTGFGSWAVVSLLLRGDSDQPQTTVSPTPVFTSTPTPLASTPAPTPLATADAPTTNPEPTREEVRLGINPGTTVQQSGNLAGNQTLAYVLSAGQGERLSVRLQGSRGIVMSVLDSNGNPLDQNATGVSAWDGEVPYKDDYSIELKTAEGIDRGSYNLTVDLQPAPTAAPTTAPSPSPTQAEPQVQERAPIQFGNGETSTTVSDQAPAGTVLRYPITVQENQTLTVTRVSGNAQFTIRYPDGRVVEDAEGLSQWQAQVPTGGTYSIDVVGAGAGDFSLDVSAR
ncbi:serine/threonine-protein kinase [Leptolyngbya sp. FACHB-261]|uniref:serine/threonine-protein kinase n=1 Tax=Leptolyngbya sp. FACHB-261 TaxID=2692806 RepID=UPI0016887C47|nr:serine/threonine-protein kinase [Leptolyngbya sp. FACHB-261]MBD2102127.1 protein kinase [Leptolyngbya sp. FACHB-261]